MIVERRAYSLRPGAATAFWELQRQYNGGAAMRHLLSHTICYFETLAGTADQIVHLHRFDSMQDWEDTYSRLYREHPAEYFVQARDLLVAQENMFSRPGPLATSPLTSADRPVAPFSDDLVVVEERRDLLPGAAQKYWDSVQEFAAQRPDLFETGLLGAYLSFVGPLHRVLTYRYFPDARELAGHRVELSGSPEADEHRKRIAPLVRSSSSTLLKPAPVTSHRPLFEPGQAETA